MSTPIIILIVVALFGLAIFTIVSKIIANIKRGIVDGSIAVTNTSTNIENSRTTTVTSDSTSSLPVRQVTYIVKTSEGMSRSSQSFQGKSTSTVTKTVGSSAGDGKVVTSLAELSAIESQIPVRLHGQISDRNQALIEPFVACIEEVFQGINSSGNPVWGIAGSETQPLFIEIADGIVQIINQGYGLTFKITERTINGYVQGRPMYLPQEDSLVYNETTGQVSRRFCGLEVGDEVVVFGTVIQTEMGVDLTAVNITLTR